MSQTAKDGPKTGGVFVPDLMTPEQFRDRVTPAGSTRGEVRLLIAIMEDAVNTFQRFASRESSQDRRLFDETAAWIQSQDRSWPYSFENVCEALALEPTGVRNGLERWRTEYLRGEREAPGPRRRVVTREKTISRRRGTGEQPPG